jgi:hypothetical protein
MYELEELKNMINSKSKSEMKDTINDELEKCKYNMKQLQEMMTDLSTVMRGLQKMENERVVLLDVLSKDGDYIVLPKTLFNDINLLDVKSFSDEYAYYVDGNSISYKQIKYNKDDVQKLSFKCTQFGTLKKLIVSGHYICGRDDIGKPISDDIIKGYDIKIMTY